MEYIDKKDKMIEAIETLKTSVVEEISECNLPALVMAIEALEREYNSSYVPKMACDSNNPSDVAEWLKGFGINQNAGQILSKMEYAKEHGSVKIMSSDWMEIFILIWYNSRWEIRRTTVFHK